MSQEPDMVIVPLEGDPLSALTMIYAIRDAVKERGMSGTSRARNLAITKLEEAAMWMRVAAEEEGE